jgi:hypothetical protein
MKTRKRGILMIFIEKKNFFFKFISISSHGSLGLIGSIVFILVVLIIVVGVVAFVCVKKKIYKKVPQSAN